MRPSLRKISNSWGYIYYVQKPYNQQESNTYESEVSLEDGGRKLDQIHVLLKAQGSHVFFCSRVFISCIAFKVVSAHVYDFQSDYDGKPS